MTKNVGVLEDVFYILCIYYSFVSPAKMPLKVVLCKRRLHYSRTYLAFWRTLAHES